MNDNETLMNVESEIEENDNIQSNQEETSQTPNDTDNQKSAENTKDKKADSSKYTPASEIEDFSLPDGVNYDKSLMDEFKDTVKGKLSQEDSQKLIDLVMKNNELSLKSWEAQSNQWINEIQNDREIGGEKLTESLMVAKRAIKQFGGDEAIKLFNENPLYGNNPTLIKLLYKAGLNNPKEDKIVKGSPVGTQRTAEEVMYGK